MLETNATRAGVEVTVKSESQLQKSDLDNALFVMGPIVSFSQWNSFGIPIEKSGSGFKIDKFSFDESLYGFSYISSPDASPARIVISGNSLEAYKQVNNMPSFGFEYVVLNNAVPELIGNGSHISDLKALKKSLYTPIESKYYVFMVSGNLDLDDRKANDAEIEKFDKHAESFVKKMGLSLPEKKIKTYIHATQEEIKYVCGFFNALCGGITHGFVTGDEIHSWKWGGAIEHEANHHLFAQVHEMAPTFLLEGIQKWYEYTMNVEEREKGFQRAREFADEDLTNVICGRADFFQGDKYYLISGIFTDYLIDAYGLDKFKKLYRYETRDILSGFETSYGKSLSKILEEYKEWLTKSIN